MIAGPLFVVGVLFGPGLPLLILWMLVMRGLRNRRMRRWREGKIRGPMPVA